MNKKGIIAIVVAAVAVALAVSVAIGTANNDKAQYEKDDTATTDNSEAIIEPSTDEPSTEEPTEAEKSIVIDTPYFTITLPNSWEGKFLADDIVHVEDDGSYVISINEKIGYEGGFGGHLIAYGATPDYEATNISGGYCDFDEINVDGQTVYLYSFRATDIQYDMENPDIYRRLESELEDIIITVKPEYK